MHSSDSTKKEDAPTITIFTDGASRGNPGPGGWGTVITLPGIDADAASVVELGGGIAETTNNRMELTAAIEGLRHLDSLSELQDTNFEIQIYTDSGYVINGITKWVRGWKHNGWVTKANESVKNVDLWKQLDAFTGGFTLRWQQVAGHAGIPGNERADAIATAYADKVDIQLYQGPLSSYEYNLRDVSHAGSKSGNGSGKQKNAGQSPRKSSGQAYSYVSMIAGNIQTHATWAECKARVDGRHARFRKTRDQEHENEIIKQFRAESDT